MSMFSGMRCLLLSIPKTPSSQSPSPFFFTCFRFFASSLPPTPPPILQFLETECDFSPSQLSKIMGAHKSLMRARSTQTARQAVEFLREWGFTHSQLHTAILRYPTLLTLRMDRHLKPMFHFLTMLGFSNQDLTSLISREAWLLGCSLDRNIKPKILVLEKLFGSKARLIKGLKRAPQLLVTSFEKQVEPNVDIFKKWGIEGELLSLLLSAYPSAFTVSTELLEMRVEYVRSTIGIVECSKTFVYVVGQIACFGLENVEKKVKHLESLGLLKEEVHQLIRKHPRLFSYSTDKMQHNMDFLTHTAGFQPNVVVSIPSLLGFSVENRLKPRLAVFQALSAMQQPAPNLSSIFALSEKDFFHKVVECSPHASVLKDIYKRKVNST